MPCEVKNPWHSAASEVSRVANGVVVEAAGDVHPHTRLVQLAGLRVSGIRMPLGQVRDGVPDLVLGRLSVEADRGQGNGRDRLKAVGLGALERRRSNLDDMEQC